MTPILSEKLVRQHRIYLLTWKYPVGEAIVFCSQVHCEVRFPPYLSDSLQVVTDIELPLVASVLLRVGLL